MPPLNSVVASSDEVIEIQHHIFHLNNEHHNHHHSLVESFNALLHGGNGINNGSHTGSGSGLPSSSDQQESEDLLIVICTFLVPLIVTIALIFLIATVIRKMRRAESMQEVAQRNEFKMSKKTKKGLQSTASNPIGSSSPSSKMSSLHHEVRMFPTLHGQKSLDSNASTSSSSSSSSSIYSHVPPWFLHSTTYYRSQYHLNKLNKQLSYQGSLQSFHSMQSLNHSENGISLSTNLSSDTESDISTPEKKKKSSKKLKKVLQIINIPKKMRQAQAEKNRFNIYAIPMETREQLKQIYVY